MVRFPVLFEKNVYGSFFVDRFDRLVPQREIDVEHTRSFECFIPPILASITLNIYILKLLN